ncbi:hypothetical protein B0H15DRAFT_799543 [Mycena belliarum]|uniref:F-box domain-containing protein n=1 Tax=Mycena belliarum TaxID=1033014 RepID=A0AAD6UBM1_9AGAR|nr:hypothetical protein B0H15DRAFT_799543 [Mycena belliae]
MHRLGSLLESLSEDILLLVCFQLDVTDVLSLRRVNRAFARATRSKIIWLTMICKAGSETGEIFPAYLKPPGLLDAAAAEAVVTRVSCLARKWRAKDLCPVNVWRLYLCHSINWMRLVSGSWLFVASSDNHVSKISCWDLSLVFQGYTEPLAEAFLPGQVRTARLEVQASGIIIALGLDLDSPSVHIITLRQHLGSHHFMELCRFEGSSHVLMLQGNLLGCAVRDDAIVPHLIDWVEDATYDLPSGLDLPYRRGAPHLIVGWHPFIVVIRQSALELYAHPSSDGGAVYIETVNTPPIWEVAVLANQPCAPLRLLVISSTGVELFTLEHDPVFAHPSVFAYTLLATSPGQMASDAPFYHLHAGGTGRRAGWVAVGDGPCVGTTYPHLVTMAIPSQPSDTQPPLIRWTNDLPQDPALWAYPILDFDDALGLTVIGNCFGELAIYDHVGSDPTKCCGLAPDFTEQATCSPLATLLPLDPIPLDLRLVPSRRFGLNTPDETTISHFSQDDLALDRTIWHTDWIFGNYGQWNEWQHNQGDFAWLMDHAYGFPVRIVPQAFAADIASSDIAVLLRAGNRYLVHTIDSTGPHPVGSFPLGPLPAGLQPGRTHAIEQQPCLRPPVFTARGIGGMSRGSEAGGRT